MNVWICYLHNKYAHSPAITPAVFKLSVNTLMVLYYFNMTRSQLGKEVTGLHAFTTTDVSVQTLLKTDNRFLGDL